MKRLLIVWHSRTGGTAQMARATAAAAAAAGIEVVLRAAAGTNGADLVAADGYVFAAPEISPA